MQPNQTEIVSSTTFPAPTGAKRMVSIPQGKRLPPSAPGGQPTVSLDGEEDTALSSPHTHSAPTGSLPGLDLPVVEPQAPSVSLQPRTAAEMDPDLVSVELPSGYFFYPFKELSVRNIRAKHQAKFARAAKERSTRLTVETVTSLLGGGVSALDLTIPDFYWLMYWLKLNNYAKAQLTHRYVCTNPAHLQAVESGSKPKESLINLEIVNKTTLKETALDAQGIKSFMMERSSDIVALNNLGYTLTSPTMRDSIELEEGWLGKEDEFEDIEYLADLAACIRRLDGTYVSLKDRIDAIGELTPEQTAVLRDFLPFTQAYGVNESIKVTCKECGAVNETEVSITAYDFL